MSGLRELFTFFEIGVDTSQLEAAEKKVNAFAAKLETVAKGFAAAFAGSKMLEFVEGQAAIGTALKNTAERFGVTTDMLQSFHLGMSELGQSSDQADNSLGFFMKAIGKSEEGSKGASRALAELGIRITDAAGKLRPTQDLLGDAAEGLSKLTDHAKMAAITQELFGRSGAKTMLPFLSKGRAGVAEMTEELASLGGAYSADMISKSSEATKALARLRVGFESLKSRISAVVLPVFTRLAGVLSRGMSAFFRFIDTTNGVKTALLFLGGAGVVAGLVKLAGAIRAVWASAAGPQLLAALAVGGALYLVFDDLFTLMTGGQSLIGDFLDKFGAAGEKAELVRGLQMAMEAVSNAAGVAWGAVQQLGAALGVTFADGLPGIIEATVAAIRGVAAAVMAVADGISWGVANLKELNALAHLDFKGAAAAHDAKDTVGRHLGEGLSKLFGMNDGSQDYAKWSAEQNGGAHQNAQLAAMGVGIGPTQPGPSVATAGATRIDQSRTVNTYTTKVEVNGAGDPAAVAAKVGKGVADATSEQRNRQNAQAALVGGT